MKTYDIVPRKFSIKHLDSYEETLCVCVSVCGGGGAVLDKGLSMLLWAYDENFFVRFGAAPKGGHFWTKC